MARTVRWLGAIVACAIGATVVVARPAAQVSLGAGVRIAPPARSLKDLRDQDVVKQRFDFSCGAAALATLLRYGYAEDVTEADIMVELFDLPTEAEREERRRVGFSLLDLQRVAEARGYVAQGFRLEADQLPLLGGPVIVFIEPRGYKHFAVLRGVRGNRAYLADPSRGQIRQPAYAFHDSWVQDDGTGIIFVVEPQEGLTDRTTPLTLDVTGRRLPEIMSVRELMAVRSTLAPGGGP